jgi:TatD DNase family protein
MIIDLHAHLCDPAFDADLDAVLSRAREAGVAAVVAVGESLTDAQKNLALAEQHPMIRPAAGLYPTHLDLTEADAMIRFIRENRDRLVAIGEVGLDHWMVQEEEQWEVQGEIFRQFIRLSLELDLPLNVHSRSAGRHAIAALLEHGARRVHLHAFDGKASSALPAVEAGYFFSVPPSIVLSEQKRKLVQRLPLACLLLETDSPVLGPSTGERNEPANARIALREIAALKGIREEAAESALLDNTRRCYPCFG